LQRPFHAQKSFSVSARFLTLFQRVSQPKNIFPSISVIMDCCRLTQKKRDTVTSSDLLAELDRRIKARHVQLGGYLHDADEHKKEAKRLMREGMELGARHEIKLSLEKQALHAQEEVKYRNLVGLRKLLKDAKENLTMADLLQRCTAEVQSTLEKMPDVMELSHETAGTVVSAADIELPSVPSVTDQQVTEALERLRAPSGGNTATAAKKEKESVRVPLLHN
jgi:hypothetical protein